MLFPLGLHAHTGDLVDLLLACHRRVLEHLALGRRLAMAPASTSHASIAAAAGRIRRYFADAFPLHRIDEEVDIFPRVVGVDDELDAAIGELLRDHEAHDTSVSTIVTICSDLEAHPSRLAAHAARLDEALRTLETELGAHIALEERMLFPAIARLSARERHEIVECIRARREHPFAA